MHGTSVATLSTETPMTEHAQGSGDTMTSSVEDALLHDAILEWDALCHSISACSP